MTQAVSFTWSCQMSERRGTDTKHSFGNMKEYAAVKTFVYVPPQNFTVEI